LASVQLDPANVFGHRSAGSSPLPTMAAKLERGQRKMRQVQVNKINEHLRSAPNAIIAGNFEFSDNSAPERDLPKHLSQEFRDVFAQERIFKGTPPSLLATCGTQRLDRVFFKSMDQRLEVIAAPEILSWMGSRRAKDRMEREAMRKMDCGKKEEASRLLEQIKSIPEPFGLHNGLRVVFECSRTAGSTSTTTSPQLPSSPRIAGDKVGE
jgi:hypothetical protein